MALTKVKDRVRGVTSEAELIILAAANAPITLGANITLTQAFSPTIPYLDTNGYIFTLGANDIGMSNVGVFLGTPGCFNINSTGRVTGLKESNPDMFGTIDGISDEVQIEYANNATDGGVVRLTLDDYVVSSSGMTIDKCTLKGNGQDNTTITTSGTITISEASTGIWYTTGRVHDLSIKTGASYASTALRVTGYVNRQNNVIDNVRITSNISGGNYDITAGSIGLELKADVSDGTLQAVANSTFGSLIIEGYEYGLQLYCNDDATGVAYINSNTFTTLKIIESKYCARFYSTGAGVPYIYDNKILDLLVQAETSTVNGVIFDGARTSYSYINITPSDWGKATGSLISWGTGNFNHIVNTREWVTKKSMDLAFGFGIYTNGLDVSQGAVNNAYLLLAKKSTQAQSIVGTVIGRRSNASSVGEYSNRTYVNITCDNASNSYCYWESDGQGVTPIVVELTYDGDVWYAISPGNTGTSAPLDYAYFDGQYTDATNQLTWVEAGDVSGVSDAITSDSTHTWQGSKILTKQTTWDPGSIANGSFEAKGITVNGAELGDFVVVSFSLDIVDLCLTAAVTASNVVNATLYNNTGGAVDLGSGIVAVKVFKK